MGDLRKNDNVKYCLSGEKQVLANFNDIIIAWDGANAGITSTNLEAVIGSTLATIKITNSDFDKNYLGFYFKSKEQFLRDSFTGATDQIVDILKAINRNAAVAL